MSVTRPETGLPKLPVGQWWRVAKVEGNAFYGDDARFIITNSREWTPDHYEVQIIQSEIVHETKAVSRGWFLKPAIEQVTRREDVVQRRRAIYKAVPAEQPYHHGFLEYHEEITPALVLEAAEALLKQIEDEAAERKERAAKNAEKRIARQQSHALLGDYPPKVLPAVAA